MGAIAAAVNKKKDNAVPTVISMLKHLKHRGADAHGVAPPNNVATADSIGQITIKNTSSPVALGHNLSRIFPQDRSQPILGRNFALVFEGRLFPSFGVPDVEAVLRTLESAPQKKAAHIIEEFEGSYAFAVAFPERVVAGRDTMGTAPLYYGEDEKTAAIASERKALWAIGMREAESFPPGNLALVSAEGFKFRPIKTVRQPSRKSTDMKTATKRLQPLLLEAVRRRTSDIKETAVAFSGGLDSSLIAMLARICGVEVQLVSVGLKGRPELRHAKAAAEALELPLRIETYTQDDVEQVLPEVLWLIEEPDVMKAGVAVPIFWAAEMASKLGFRIILAGQGADELFGGYHRYLREYAYSVEAVRRAIYQDVVRCHEKNFQRDNQACSFHKVELRLPFADQEVARFSLGLPVHLKLVSSESRLRKRILRLTARNLGMPQFIFDRKKKAVQYATGVDKALRRLAGREDLTVQGYVKKVFREVYPEGEV